MPTIRPTPENPRVRLSESVCPLDECKAPRIVIDVAGSTGSYSHEMTLELGSVRASGLDDELLQRSVWTRGMAVDRLADPCLLVAAETMEVTPTELTISIAHALRSVAGEPDGRRICKHAIELDGRLCTMLAHEHRGPGDEAVVGLIHVADLLDGSPAEPADAVLELDCATFEASPKELALSYRELMALEAWVTGNCEANLALTRPREEKEKDWGHMLFVSHAWRDNVPGIPEDLDQIKRVVEDYVSEALRIRAISDPAVLKADPNRYGINTSVVKNVETANDFGIWIDYMIVPNDLAHADCPKCKEQRDRHIAQIGALLTISTIITMDPETTDRGWLIHELTGNSHDNIVNGRKLCKLDASDLRHRHRARLMASKHKTFRVPEDGRKLRCYEFTRLGQMPRCWPAVNAQFLRALEAGCFVDERSVGAAPLLYRHARHFDLPCHALKRAMVEMTQTLARATSSPAAPIDLEDFAIAVDQQAAAMRELHAKLQPGPDQDHGLLPIDDAVEQVHRLQTHQFVEVALGLRVETTRRAGFGSWVKLTEIVDALAATKFMARLFEGIVTQKKVSCNVTLYEGSTESRKQGTAWTERLSLAEDVAHRGVRIDALERAYGALG